LRHGLSGSESAFENAEDDVSTSFSEEKEAKRLWLIEAFGADRAQARRKRNFLLLFFAC
jgi:hypothetical protein